MMNSISPDLWLLSREPGTGGTNTAVKIAMEILAQARMTYRYAYIKDFSSRAKRLNELNYRSLPLPVYLNNLLAGRKWKKRLNKPAAHGLVIGGTPAAGGIAYASGINYGMWIGTTVRDEFRIIKTGEEIKNRDFSRVLNKILININNIAEAAVLKRARYIICQSLFTKDCIKRDYNVEDDKIFYPPFPIQIKRKYEKPYDDKAPIILGVGRVDDARKNYSFLLRAFKDLVEVRPSSRLRIAGNISVDSKIRQESVKLGIGSHVTFLGEISSSDLQKEYENADIFALTPRQEGLGIVFLEAMSYGLPVVTTKCGGSEGIIQDGFNGYLIEQNELEQFTESIEKIMESKSKYEAMSHQAYRYILENHDPDKFSMAFLRIIRERL